MIGARHAVREIERFMYREVLDAEGEEQVTEERNLLRLVIGLRRGLDRKELKP